MVLATDLHAGNVLSAGREPWLVLDPKPFTGDPTFDVVQHLLNHPDRLEADALGLIHRVAGLASLDADRVRRWLLVRLVLGPSMGGHGERLRSIAHRLAP